MEKIKNIIRKSIYFLCENNAIVYLLLTIFVISGDMVINYTNSQTYEITINDKQVKRAYKHDKYLVFATTKTGENIVFENTDLWFKGKFNSSDIQGKIVLNHNYKITTIGNRIPILSRYQNIVSVEDIN